MGNVVQFRKPDDIGRLRDTINEAKTSSDGVRKVDNGGGPPHNGDMEARVQKLENLAEATRDKLASVDTRIAVMDQRIQGIESSMKTSMATKADVAEAKNSIIMWVVSAVLLAQVLPMLLKKLGL